MLKKTSVIGVAIATALAVPVALAPPAQANHTRICVESDSQSGTYVIVTFQRPNGTTYLDYVVRDECSDEVTTNHPIKFAVPNHETCVSQWGGRYVGPNTWSTSLLRGYFGLDCYKW